jgi:hypothetical protein
MDATAPPSSAAVSPRTAAQRLWLVLQAAPLVLTLSYPVVVATLPLRTFLCVQACSYLLCTLAYLALCKGEGAVVRVACRFDEMYVAAIVLASLLHAALSLASGAARCLHWVGLLCMEYPVCAGLFLNVLMCVRTHRGRGPHFRVGHSASGAWVGAPAVDLVGRAARRGARAAAFLAKHATLSIF